MKACIAVLFVAARCDPIDVPTTNGVPDDLLDLLPSSTSPDYGLYSQCEVARGSSLESGICVPASYYGSRMPFCGEYVTYPSCVPPSNPLWPDWDLSAKDSLISSLFNVTVTERKASEVASVNSESGGDYVNVFFTGNDACVANFKKLICLFNFPRCDYSVPSDGSSDEVNSTVIDDSPEETKATFPLCEERCAEYFTACRFGAAITAQFCQSGKSIWPLVAGATKDLNISSPSLIMQAGGPAGTDCTGKGSTSLRGMTGGLAVMIIYVLTRP